MNELLTVHNTAATQAQCLLLGLHYEQVVAEESSLDYRLHRVSINVLLEWLRYRVEL